MIDARNPRSDEGTQTSLVFFISASIPDPQRWPGDFDPLEITDAVVAVAREVLAVGHAVVTAAHPTIAPLLLYVAAELPRGDSPRVVVYQSRLFVDVLPSATKRFEQSGVGQVIWTEAEPGDEPAPGRWDRSLAVMRRRMITECAPNAAVFIGGMEGIRLEYDLFRELSSGEPTFAFGYPGGEARALAAAEMTPIGERLRESSVYPALAREIVEAAENRGHRDH